LHIVRQTQRRPDFADCQTDTMEARHCILLDRHNGGQTLHDCQTDTMEARHCILLDRNNGGQTMQIVDGKSVRETLHIVTQTQRLQFVR
jgi:hypothetical protein